MHTERRIAKPASIALAGENGYRIRVNVRCMEHPIVRSGTYKEGGTVKKCIQNRYRILEQLGKFITPSEFAKGKRLFLKSRGKGLDRVTILELLGKWVFV
jgi:hypothetical protein